MTLTVNTIAARAQALGRALSHLQLSDYEAQVPAGALKFTRYRPQVLSVDLVGDGERYRQPLAGWSDRYRLQRVEYPIDEADLAVSSCGVVRSGSGWVLLLPEVIPADESCRAWYTAPHAVADPNTTVEDADLEVVARFVAAFTLRELAAQLAQRKGASTLGGADLVDLSSEATDVSRIADKLDRDALELLGAVEDDAAAGSASASASSGSAGMMWVTPRWPDGM